jgi:hypothetical protein
MQRLASLLCSLGLLAPGSGCFSSDVLFLEWLFLGLALTVKGTLDGLLYPWIHLNLNAWCRVAQRSPLDD